mgnify:CR=1 FL=1
MKPRAADERADDGTIRGYLNRIQNRKIMAAVYVHDLLHRGLIRYDTTEERYVLTLRGRNFMAMTGG